jgi:choline-sulfatase
MLDEKNVLLIMSDEHRPDALSVAGHDVVETPVLDELARSGTRFTDAYCPSPLCAPCRASFATGRYVHEVSAWDNAASYDGSTPSWPEHFSDDGVSTASVGKTDFRPGVRVFDEQIEPGHREDPDLNGLYRDPPNVRESGRDRITKAGPTEEPDWHEQDDEQYTEAAIEWLSARADEDGVDPWVLSLNYILPHFPLTAEREYYEQYPESSVDLPYDNPAADDHPIVEELRDHFDGREIDEETLRRARSAYYALCTRLDENVGRVLDALDRFGLAEDTLVVYTSDHGEMLGDHECWWKCTMYEQSVGVPLIARGPNVAENEVVERPVSILDLIPTMADATGVAYDSTWRGESLTPILRGEDDPNPDRTVFSEYHSHGTSYGAFMIRQNEYKYVYYPENPDQLFDLEADPREMTNLADDPEFRNVRKRLENELRSIVDPEAVDQQAHEDQKRRREQPVEEWW